MCLMLISACNKKKGKVEVQGVVLISEQFFPSLLEIPAVIPSTNGIRKLDFEMRIQIFPRQ